MHSGDELPLVTEDASLGDLLIEMSSKSLGMVGVVGGDGRLLGMFTDGDLRRTLENQLDMYSSSARDVMTRDPYTISPDTLAEEIVRTMRDFAQRGPHAINGLFVVDEEGKVIGALNTHDLRRVGVI